ncbi:MAG: hypothetical protein EXS51_02890 [Candidatus Taylorbacteria bacterium]|nr:hypothetical protein [Candidatus Taylorbacteria bacterium]
MSTEKMNIPENTSLDSLEGVSSQSEKTVEKTILPELRRLFTRVMFERDTNAGAVKQWLYRIPSLDNAILSLALEGRSDKGGLFVTGAFFEKEGNDFFDSKGVGILDSIGSVVGEWEGGQFSVEPDKIFDGLFIERDGKRHTLVAEAME